MLPNSIARSLGISRTKKLGARSGTLLRISLLMLVWIVASVTNKVRPSPSATTSACVCDPGRCKLDRASLNNGALGRGIRTAIRRKPHAMPVSNTNRPQAAAMKISEKRGSRAVPTANVTIAAIAAVTDKAVRLSVRLLFSTMARNSPAAGTVLARASGGNAKASAIKRP